VTYTVRLSHRFTITGLGVVMRASVQPATVCADWENHTLVLNGHGAGNGILHVVSPTLPEWSPSIRCRELEKCDTLHTDATTITASGPAGTTVVIDARELFACKLQYCVIQLMNEIHWDVYPDTVVYVKCDVIPKLLLAKTDSVVVSAMKQLGNISSDETTFEIEIAKLCTNHRPFTLVRVT
jgi:hypothetical protein